MTRSLDEPKIVWRGKPGARGLVKHAYHVAAELTPYAITVDPARRLTLGGTLAASDPHWLTQRPLVFVVPTKAGVCRWPIESLTVADGQLTARLGALLERE